MPSPLPPLASDGSLLLSDLNVPMDDIPNSISDLEDQVDSHGAGHGRNHPYELRRGNRINYGKLNRGTQATGERLEEASEEADSYQTNYEAYFQSFQMKLQAKASSSPAKKHFYGVDNAEDFSVVAPFWAHFDD
ncbi:hypothetical protein ACLOJK_019184 [Asimina triloba]